MQSIRHFIHRTESNCLWQILMNDERNSFEASSSGGYSVTRYIRYMLCERVHRPDSGGVLSDSIERESRRGRIQSGRLNIEREKS